MSMNGADISGDAVQCKPGEFYKINRPILRVKIDAVIDDRGK